MFKLTCENKADPAREKIGMLHRYLLIPVVMISKHRRIVLTLSLFSSAVLSMLYVMPLHKYTSGGEDRATALWHSGVNQDGHSQSHDLVRSESEKDNRETDSVVDDDGRTKSAKIRDSSKDHQLLLPKPQDSYEESVLQVENVHETKGAFNKFPNPGDVNDSSNEKSINRNSADDISYAVVESKNVIGQDVAESKAEKEKGTDLNLLLRMSSDNQKKVIIKKEDVLSPKLVFSNYESNRSVHTDSYVSIPEGTAHEVSNKDTFVGDSKTSVKIESKEQQLFEGKAVRADKENRFVGTTRETVPNNNPRSKVLQTNQAAREPQNLGHMAGSQAAREPQGLGYRQGTAYNAAQSSKFDAERSPSPTFHSISNPQNATLLQQRQGQGGHATAKERLMGLSSVVSMPETDSSIRKEKGTPPVTNESPEPGGSQAASEAGDSRSNPARSSVGGASLGRVGPAGRGQDVNRGKEEGNGTGVDDLPTRGPRPTCVGANTSLGEVEDLLCMPKPDYENRTKNPCWWSEVPAAPPSDRPYLSRGDRSISKGQYLLCLPYFHILCCSKSGTTDLFRRMSFHGDLVPNKGALDKEPLYWSWGKYGLNNRDRGVATSFAQYLYNFIPLTNRLTLAFDNDLTDDLQRLVTLDGSPPDMWDFRGWEKLPQNRGLRHPTVLTPHLMEHLYRQPRFIVMVREPIERLYTSYLFHRHGKTAHQFHGDVIRAISLMESCLQAAHNRLECFVNITVNDVIPMFLPYSCYAVYFAEWLKVFPKRHFLFVRTEDYKNDVNGTLHRVFDFLDMRPPSPQELRSMLNAPIAHHTKEKDAAGPMMSQTRQLLRNWFRPYMEELHQLMGDTRFLWQDVYDQWDRAPPPETFASPDAWADSAHALNDRRKKVFR